MRNQRKPVDYDRQLSDINARLRQQINNNAALLKARHAAAAGQPAYTPSQQSPDTRSAAEKRMDIMLQSENLRKNLRKLMTSDEVAQVMTRISNHDIQQMVSQWPMIEKYTKNFADVTPTQLLNIWHDIRDLSGIPEMDSNLVKTRTSRARQVADIERSMMNLRQVMATVMPAIQEVLKSATNISAYAGLQNDLIYLKRLNELVAMAPRHLDEYMSTAVLNELLSLTSNFPTLRQVNEILASHLTPDMTLRQGGKFKDFIKPIVRLLYLTPRQLDEFRQALGINDADFQQIMDVDQSAVAAPFSGDVGLALLGDVTDPTEQAEDEYDAPAMGDAAAGAPFGEVILPAAAAGAEGEEAEAEDQEQPSGPLIEEESASEFKINEFIGHAFAATEYYTMGSGLSGYYGSFSLDDTLPMFQTGQVKTDSKFEDAKNAINEFIALYNQLIQNIRSFIPSHIELGNDLIPIEGDASGDMSSASKKGTLRRMFLKTFINHTNGELGKILNSYGRLECHAIFDAVDPELLATIPKEDRRSWVFYKLFTNAPEFESVKSSRIYSNLRTTWENIFAARPDLFDRPIPLSLYGMGLSARHRQRARISRIAGRNVMIGRGLQIRPEYYVESPNMGEMMGVVVKEDQQLWVPFGCFKVNKRTFLKTKKLAVKHVESSRNVDGLGSTDLREKPEVFALLQQIMKTHSMDYQLLSKINNDDRKWLAMLFHRCKLDDIYEITYEDHDTPRFELLRAHIMAGGNNKEELREFRQLLMKFVREGRVRERDALEIIQEMMEL